MTLHPGDVSRRWSRLGLAALVVIGAVWSFADPVSAHANLAGSDPADGEVVTEPLERITFTFTAAVEPFVDGYRLVGPDGTALPIGSVEQPEPSTVVVVPAAPIEVPVEAIWAIVSPDSHPVTGAIVVGVDVPPPTATSTSTTPPTTTTAEAATTPSSSPSTTSTTDPIIGEADGGADGPSSPASVEVQEQMEILRNRVTDDSISPTTLVSSAVRWVTYVATAAIIGAATLALVAGTQSASVWRWTRPWLWVAVAMLAVSTVLTVGAQLSELTGDATDVWSVADWGDVLEGRFRTGVLVRLAGALLVAVAFSIHRRHRLGPFAIGAIAILASYPILGHTTDGSVWIATPATMIHVGAISVWVGGLGAVLIVGARASRPHFVAIVRTFSRLAGVALAATVVAGVGLTVVQLDAVTALWDSAYGQRLTIKVALVAAVAALGAFHHYRTVPNLDSDSNKAATRFSQLALVEMIGFAAVLAATSWLVIAAGE